MAEGASVNYLWSLGCDKHHDREQPGEERVTSSFVLVHHPGKSGQEFKQGRNQLEIGTDAEVIKNVMLTSLLLMASLACMLMEPVTTQLT